MEKFESVIDTKNVTVYKGVMRAKRTQTITFIRTLVNAGLPSRVSDSDEEEDNIDLNDYFVRNPGETYFVRINGESLTGIGVLDGDFGILDIIIEPSCGDLVLAHVDGDYIVKELAMNQDRTVSLLSHHPDYEPIMFERLADCRILGVITSTIRTRRALYSKRPRQLFRFS